MANTTTTTLNLDDNDQDAHRNFIQAIRNTTGSHILQLLPQGGFNISPTSKRAAYVGQVGVTDWVFTVGLILGGQQFDVAIQRYFHLCQHIGFFAVICYLIAVVFVIK